MSQTTVQQNNIVVYRGDDWGCQLTFTDTDGMPIDITGWTIFLTIKVNKDDPDDQAVVTKTVPVTVDPQLGKITITVSSAETYNLDGLYYYDFQFKKQDETIQTLTSGGITFEKDITRRTG